MLVFNTLLPIVSVLFGAAITYLINVRQRRHSYIEDLFNQAIAAVAAAEISVDYISSVGRPEHISDFDLEQLQSYMVMEGMKNWATKVSQANDALARVLPYLPQVASVLPFSPDSAHRGTHLPVIGMLRGGPESV